MGEMGFSDFMDFAGIAEDSLWGGLSKDAHRGYMRRCLALAERGWGRVSPNPMVGAVLVRDGVVVAEGWHAYFGGAHAERMLFEGLDAGDNGGSGDGLGGELELRGQNEDFSDCILYVSLEPCAHFGKTPPCANLILEKGVGRVVVGVLDPNPLVSGKGVEILRAAGVEVLVGVLEDECRGLNRMFWVNQVLGRTAVVAKWAETRDGFMGLVGDETSLLLSENQIISHEAPLSQNERLLISGEGSGRWVHKLRAGVDAILVGVNTWNSDQPKLNVRGLEVTKQPIRIVLDRNGRGEYTSEGLSRSEGELWVVGGDLDLVELLRWLYREKGLGVILVEGGASILQSFLDADCVDEIHILRNSQMHLGSGIKSPNLDRSMLNRKQDLGTDEHWVWHRKIGGIGIETREGDRAE
ncbi:MAG: 5-amino-6-(5-phosphoribosylamino)uracil reductase [Bacteroidota bacterium]|jgi:diaminohydroxyphosphoribosylaminopyrimidine deaminase/5-amino-6-(5-phosphoribosylamino)uracil reductase